MAYENKNETDNPIARYVVGHVAIAAIEAVVTFAIGLGCIVLELKRQCA
jgi:hypothetical protein